MNHRLPEPLQHALGELAAIQTALKRPIADEEHLEAVWKRMLTLRRQLTRLEPQLQQVRARAVAQRCLETLDGLTDALAPVREERLATRALEEAIHTFEQQINRPAAGITRPEDATRLLEILQQLRWKVDSIPAGSDPAAPRARAIESLREAMDHAGRQLTARASALEGLGRVGTAERALARIVDEAANRSEPEALARAMERLRALGRSLEATRPSLSDPHALAALDRVAASVVAVHAQLRGIAEGLEAARVIRNAIHGHNAAARTLERGPSTPEVARNLRAHLAEITAALDSVRGHEMTEALRAQHRQIEDAIRALLDRL